MYIDAAGAGMTTRRLDCLYVMALHGVVDHHARMHFNIVVHTTVCTGFVIHVSTAPPFDTLLGYCTWYAGAAAGHSRHAAKAHAPLLSAASVCACSGQTLTMKIANIDGPPGYETSIRGPSNNGSGAHIVGDEIWISGT